MIDHFSVDCANWETDDPSTEEPSNTGASVCREDDNAKIFVDRASVALFDVRDCFRIIGALGRRHVNLHGQSNDAGLCPAYARC